MSNLFGSKPASVTPEVYTGIQVSTSMLGSAIPLIYGMNRSGMNLLWYGNWAATPNKSSSGGKGGGGNAAASSYTYTASWAGALAVGPISGVGQIWHDRAIVTLAYEDLTLYLGAGGQAAWTVPPSAQQIPYDHTAYVAAPAYNLGSSASMPNLTFEIQGLLYNTGPPGPQFGGTFTGDLTAGSNVINNVAPPGALVVGSILSDSSGAIPSGAVVTGIATSSGSNTGKTVSFSGGTAGSTISGDTISFTVTGLSAGDADPSLIVNDYLTDPNHGAFYVGSVASLSGNNAWQGYCWALGIGLSPVESTQRQANDFLSDLAQITNSEIFEVAGVLHVIPYADAYVSGNGYSYDPSSSGNGQLVPLYSFTDDDYLAKGDDDPVELIRTPLSKTYNDVIVEYLDRANYYNAAPAEAFDLDDINANGRRLAPTYTFHSITNAVTAKQTAQLLLQASLYRRNSYKFSVRADYCLLNPMDPIALTDSGLGLVAQLCWITEIALDAEGEMTITALEVTGHANTVPQYNWGAAQGFAQNYNASPGNVDNPHIFMLPPFLASDQGAYTLGIAVCGGQGNANWAGCQAYASIDGGTTYFLLGLVTSGARYGTLTSNFPSGTDPDTTDTLSITLYNTALQINPATSSDADGMQTLILIDDATNGAEIVAYSAATLVGSGQYNLGTYLRRGQYQTAISAHAAGTIWVRLDGSILQLECDPGWLGQTIYFKFCSFNQAGQALQSLANVVAYSYQLEAGAVGTGLAVVTTGSAIAYDYHVAKATTGSNSWDSCVYSKMGFPACQATARPQTTSSSGLGMVGFSTNPSASSFYSNANYGLYASYYGGATRVEIWEAGTQIATFGTYAIGDLLSVTYDGANVRYLQNNVLLHTTPAVGLTLYLFMPMLYPGGVFSDVTFTQITRQQNAVTWNSRGSNGVAASGNQLQSQNASNGLGVSDAYTQQLYANGATFSCRFPVAKFPRAGLSTALSGSTPYSPSTGGGSTSMFLWAPQFGSAYDIAEVINGTASSYSVSGTPAATDVLSVEYDGLYVRYYLNGALVRTSAPMPGMALCGYFTSGYAGDIAADYYFASVPAATPNPFVAYGTAVTNDSTATKTGSSTNWDGAAWSINSYGAGGCHVQGKTSVVANATIMGFTTTPVPSGGAMEQVIAYGVYNNGTDWCYYESATGVAFSPALPVAATDLTCITYDGSNVVTYYVNGAAVRTVTGVGAQMFYAGFAMQNQNSGFNLMSFGPGTQIDSVATAGIDQNAATSLLETTISSVTVPPTGAFTTIGSLIIPNYPYPVNIVATASGSYSQATVSSQYGLFGGLTTSSSSVPYADQHTINFPANAATATYQGLVSIEKLFTVAANAGAQTIYFLAVGANTGSGNTCTISEVMIKAEIIKL